MVVSILIKWNDSIDPNNYFKYLVNISLRTTKQMQCADELAFVCWRACICVLTSLHLCVDELHAIRHITAKTAMPGYPAIQYLYKTSMCCHKHMQTGLILFACFRSKTQTYIYIYILGRLINRGLWKGKSLWLVCRTTPCTTAFKLLNDKKVNHISCLHYIDTEPWDAVHYIPWNLGWMKQYRCY